MAENKNISKIQLSDGTVVNLKDAAGRSNLETLVGTGKTVGTAVLGAAAWEAVASAITSTDTGLVSADKVKSYVDAQVGAIDNFDVKVYETLPTAGEDTMYVLALVPEGNSAAPGAYIEHITVRSGSAGSYTYAWEQIGSTDVDLTDYLKTADAEAWTVAGVSFTSGHSIAAADIKTALSLGSLADKDSASGDVTYSKVNEITMAATEVSGNAAVTYTSTAASLTKGDFTPAGTVAGTVTATGTVNVTLADATSATDATVSYSAYTPAGTVAPAASNGTFTALKTAAFSAATSDTGVQITGSVAAPSVTLNFTGIDVYTGISSAAVLPSFTEGAFTAASWTGSSYTAPTYTGYSYTAPTMGTASTGTFATDGVVMSFNSAASAADADYECLVFTTVASASKTATAVTAQGTFSAGAVDFGTFSAGAVDFGTFSGGSKVADTWDAGSAATFTTAKAVPSTVTASANAPTFTGGYFSVTTTEDTALKNVEFTGTEQANAIVTGVTYVKPVISNATFSGTSADISATFSGTKVSDALVTGVSYDKADASAAFSVSVTPTVSQITYSSATTSVTVS